MEDIYFSLEDFAQIITSILNAELFSLQSQPITVAKVLISIVIFSIGAPISRRIARYFTRKILAPLHIQANSLHVLESIIFYVLLCFFVLLSLKTANIPLTIFNVIGGALAIGVGFGSKEIMNNFISGLIILFEKPIKIGDFLKIDDQFGKVDSVGMRSTKLTTVGNKHLTVPNSKFLENSVYNWSFNDSTVRSHLKVGVAYGSDIIKVEEIIRKTIIEHTNVLDNKEIKIFLTNFGDSSIDFEGYYFIQIRKHLDEVEVASDIRKKLFQEFKKNEITIPFPQRDVHIHKDLH